MVGAFNQQSIIQEINQYFAEMENTLKPMSEALLGQPSQRTIIHLMSDLRELEHELVKDAESRRITDSEKALTTVRDLRNVFHITLNPTLSDDEKLKEINRFRDETRNSTLSVKQKLLILTILGSLLVAAPLVSVVVLASLYPLLVLSNMIPPALGLSAALFTGVIQLGKVWAFEYNPDHSRGEKVCYGLKAMIRERSYLNAKRSPDNQTVMADQAKTPSLAAVPA